ncbi:hypothetical protein R1sor_005149 [Riccia sorocarpa]|uniref:Uncharacterized protein n=1 Tax=Riccia sorocarpa TaxID=122646 RepID=A0ABD3HJC3_9MARC
MKQQGSVFDIDTDQTLDLPGHCGDQDHTQGYGWLSPRISFSADFVSGLGSRGSEGEIMEIMSPEGSCSSRISRDGSSTSTEFEFAMATSTFHNALFEGTADELFHGGKLLPGFITPDGKKEVLIVEPFLVPLEVGESLASTCATTGPATVPRESLTKSSSTAGPSPRNSKQGKWRELFATLRRVKSDSGRHRYLEEILPPPPKAAAASIQVPRKKFFRHFFSSHGLSATPTTATQESSSHPPSSSSSSSPFDSKETNNVVNPPQTSAEVAAETCAGEYAASSRGKGIQSSGTGRNGGRLGMLGVPLWRVEKPVITSANLEPIRGLRSREMRRSPDNRAVYSSNIRVTPILSVPGVCMGPALRGSSKAGDKGRLSNFRSFLSFKREKLPTALSTPIATQ